MVAQKQNVFTVFGTKLILYSVLVIVNFFYQIATPATISSVPDILYEFIQHGPVIITSWLNILSILLLCGIFIVGLIVGASFMKQGDDLSEKKLKAAGGLFFWYHMATFIAGMGWVVVGPALGPSFIGGIYALLYNSLTVLGMVGWIMMLVFFVGHKDNKMVIPGIIGSIIVFSTFALYAILNLLTFIGLYLPFSIFPFTTIGYITCAVCFFIVGSKGGLDAAPAASKDVGWARPSTGAGIPPSAYVPPSPEGSTDSFPRASIEPKAMPMYQELPATSPGPTKCDGCGEPFPADSDLQFCPNCGSKISR